MEHVGRSVLEETDNPPSPSAVTHLESQGHVVTTARTTEAVGTGGHAAEGLELADEVGLVEAAHVGGEPGPIDGRVGRAALDGGEHAAESTKASEALGTDPDPALDVPAKAPLARAESAANGAERGLAVELVERALHPRHLRAVHLVACDPLDEGVLERGELVLWGTVVEQSLAEDGLSLIHI